MNTKKYKATFILDTRGYTEPVETLIEKIKSVVESCGCKIESVEKKSFARTTDRNFPVGIYVDVNYEGESSSNALIKEKFRLDKTVNRILVLSK